MAMGRLPKPPQPRISSAKPFRAAIDGQIPVVCNVPEVKKSAPKSFSDRLLA